MLVLFTILLKIKMTYNIKDMNACFIYNLVENKK